MFRTIRNHLRAEGGAITVDWVVLSAAVITLGVSAVIVVQNEIVHVSSKISNSVDVDNGN